MAGKTKGLITKQDKQEFLRSIYEEDAGSKILKKMEEVYAEEYKYADCAYCNKPYNYGKGQRLGEFPNKWIVSECPHCKKENWTRIKVVREGTMFEGYNWNESEQMLRKEEIPNKAKEVDTGERHYGDQEDIFTRDEVKPTEKKKPEPSPILRRVKTGE